VHLVGFIVRIGHDARSSERQNTFMSLIYNHLMTMWVLTRY